MLDNKNHITLYIKEVMKKIILEAQYPKDVDPSSVKLQVPYKNGIIATLQDIKDAIAKIEIDPDIDLTNLVDITSNQDIKGIKKFQNGLQSLIVPKDDNDVVRLAEIKALYDQLLKVIQEPIEKITKIENSIGNLENINIELGEGIDFTIENILNKMVELIGEGGPGGDVFYTNMTRVPNTLGGVVAGTTFDNVKLQDVITMLLYPYQAPAITQFSTNIKTNYKLGESTPNSLTLTWKTSNPDNIKDGSIVFYFNGNELPKENFPKNGSKTFSITPVKLNNQGSITIKMEMLDIKGSKISKTITLTWLNEIYYGNNTNTTITSSDVEAFSTVNANSVGRDYNYPGGGYKYLVFPASWGDPSQFVDPKTNFDVPMEKHDNITIVNENGISQTYKVYRSTNVLNGDITIRVKN